MKRQVIFTAIALAIACATGCASHSGPSTFNRNEVGRAQTVEAGTVTAIRPVTIQSDGSVVGTATGAVLGGLAGNTIGGGRGRTAATVAGAVAGGAAGQAVTGSTRAGVEITVELQSGRTVAVVQEGTPEQFRVGDRVNVASDGVTTRVTRLN